LAIKLETPRLVLREMTEADAERLRVMNEHPNVLRFTGDGRLADDAQAIDLLRSRVFPQYQRGVGRWAIVERAGGQFVGWCGLKWDADAAEYDLGYRLLEAHWGRGYATEAARACLEWGRRELVGQRIVARVHVENAASIRVLEKIGLRRIGEEDSPIGRLIVFEDG
jgi:RimJ/RimL family protein N-acetyltransferase